MKRYLLTPGPTPVPESVLLATAQPVIHHRTPEFGKVLVDVTEGLKYVFQTKNDIFTYVASGTGVMESAIVNLLSPGDRVLVMDTGNFGSRWAKILKAYGIEPEVVKYPWGKAAKVEDLKERLKKASGIKAVFTQSTETSTGVVNDIEGMGRAVKDTEAVLVVDAVSGLAGQDLKTDAWNVDVVVSGSQKGLMLPPGLGFVSISAKAWDLVEKAKLPRFYYDFKTFKKTFVEKKQGPYTPAVNLLLGLREVLRLINEEGLENMFKRFALLACAARAGVAAIGLEMFAEVPCNVVTAVKVPAGIDGKALVKRMRDEYGVGVAGGQGEYEGKIFRIAHMGYIGRFDIIVALASLEMMLNTMGHKVELGRAVSAAEKVFLGN